MRTGNANDYRTTRKRRGLAVLNSPLHSIWQKLAEERTRLLRRIAAETQPPEQEEEVVSEAMDRAYRIASRELQSALLVQARHRLEQVDAALKRLDEGSYGICVACGLAISPERLKILPEATTCINCQRQHERM